MTEPPRRQYSLGVFDDAEAAADNAGRFLIGVLGQMAADQGHVAIAVSGGRSPWRMLAEIGEAELPWDAIEIFQVDERILPDGDPGRNLTHILAALPEHARERVRPMPVTEDDIEAAAASYEESLPPFFNLIHLGLGPDGHTASLVPGDSVLEVTDRRVAVTGGEYQGTHRMTLTYPALAASQAALWLVTGEDKREALPKLLNGDASIPAGRVEIGDSIVIADRMAAADLQLGEQAPSPGPSGPPA